jgi:hypothetical protein
MPTPLDGAIAIALYESKNPAPVAIKTQKTSA